MLSKKSGNNEGPNNPFTLYLSAEGMLLPQILWLQRNRRGNPKWLIYVTKRTIIAILWVN
jgi:hypothetical protein